MNFDVPGSLDGQNIKARLYTFSQAQKACSSGSHVASPEEWESLIKSLENMDSLEKDIFTKMPNVLNLNFSKNGHYVHGEHRDLNENNWFWTSKYRWHLLFMEEVFSGGITQIYLGGMYVDVATTPFACRCILN